MNYGDYYWGLYRDYYRDPFPHSLLSTRELWWIEGGPAGQTRFGSVRLRGFGFDGCGRRCVRGQIVSICRVEAVKVASSDNSSQSAGWMGFRD